VGGGAEKGGPEREEEEGEGGVGAIRKGPVGGPVTKRGVEKRVTGI